MTDFRFHSFIHLLFKIRKCQEKKSRSKAVLRITSTIYTRYDFLLHSFSAINVIAFLNVKKKMRTPSISQIDQMGYQHTIKDKLSLIEDTVLSRI